MRNWLSALIAGPDGAVDEAALFVCALGVMTFGSWVVFITLAVFVVLHGAHFEMMEFCQGVAIILASGGTTAGIIEAFIGTRNKCNSRQSGS